MTGTFNKTLILGHLGGDPEIHSTKGGREIARFTVATNERFTDKSGDRQERTDWHRAVIFTDGLIGNVVKPYLKEGSKVRIEGSNRNSSYTDKDGVERSGNDIIVRDLTLCDRPSGDGK